MSPPAARASRMERRRRLAEDHRPRPRHAGRMMLAGAPPRIPRIVPISVDEHGQRTVRPALLGSARAPIRRALTSAPPLRPRRRELGTSAERQVGRPERIARPPLRPVGLLCFKSTSRVRGRCRCPRDAQPVVRRAGEPRARWLRTVHVAVRG